MNNIVLEKVWTQNSPIVVDNLIGTTVTGESEAHTFRVRGVDAAQEPVAITGTITGKLLNANNDTVALTGSLSNGIASVTLTETCYAVPGRFIISIFATNADVTQCLYCGVGNVFRASSSSIAYPTDSLPDITSLMADLEEILDGWPADYSQIQAAVTTLQSDVSDLKSQIGNTTMGTTAATVTGAIAEHEGDITVINTALAGKQATLTFDSTPTVNSTNPVTSGGIKTALDGKQNTLTFDNSPTYGSDNPVKSGGVYTSVTVKVNKPTSSPNGTSGQVLRTNGDGTTTWVDVGLPTDAQTAEAFSDWLDDHPEATTTVQDGSITKAKFNSALQEEIDYKAPAIVINTDSNTYHGGLTNVKEVTFIGNSLAFSKARYAKSQNLMPSVTGTKTLKDVDITLDGHFIIYDGVSSGYGGTNLIDEETDIPAGDYTFILDMSGTDPGHARTRLRIYYDDSSYYDVCNDYITSSKVYAFTAAKKITRILYNGTVSGTPSVTYDNFRFWLGLYAGTNVVTDTDETVPSDGSLQYSSAGLSSITSIDTMQHSSTVEYIADTKGYVDDHTPDIIGYWNQNIYALPENFGAVGDGVADDGTALASCISYAISSGKAVKGYGHYKTSATVVLPSAHMSVFLKQLTYTGNQYAVELQNNYIDFSFDKISSSGKGIYFGKTSTGTVRRATRARVTGIELNCDSDCITVGNLTYYNTVDIRVLSSANGNCVVGLLESGNESVGGEYVFMSSACHCPNGYVTYNLQNSKIYNFTVEADCKYGYLNPTATMCIGCRHAEQVGAYSHRITGQSQNNNGPLIKFTVSPNQSGAYAFRYLSFEGLPWFAIDVSEIQGFDSISAWSDWASLRYNGIDLGTPIKGIAGTSAKVIGQKMFFIGNNKVYVPEGRTKKNVGIADLDFRLLDSQTDQGIYAAETPSKYLATDLVITYSHTVIHFNSTFGAIGYNDLTITQQNGNTCEVYDKLGNLLFDGTNAGNGTWHFVCTIDADSIGRYTGSSASWWIYDGTNEIWEVTKIS